MKCRVKSVNPKIAGLRFCTLLVSISIIGFLAGCGGKKSSSSSSGSGGSGGGSTTPTGLGTWAWESGSKVADGDTSATIPGGRYNAGNWADTSGNFWLFGGEGYDSVGTEAGDAVLSDLWKYSPGASQWTLVGGSTTANQSGIYGSLGTGSTKNIPGARQGGGTWADASGNFWLFGGYGYDSQGNEGRLSDLWKYTPSSNAWTWVAGTDLANQAGVYGTLKQADGTTNNPGARNRPVAWIDASGNLWLFGGYGYDSQGNEGWLNDLWMFDPSTGYWTWMSGSDVYDQNGNYGKINTAASTNVPGGRNVAVGWADSSGNLWLFGGNGYDSVGTNSYLNDLWKYNISAGEWTWVSGSDIANQAGTYGTEQTAGSGNVPGSRWGSFTWIDSSGNLWLFGGNGNPGEFNDVWEFSPSTSEWTWQDGDDTPDNVGIYGTESSASASNLPGGRERGETWVDSSGNVWIFGGVGYDSVGTLDGDGYMNDLWKYQP